MGPRLMLPSMRHYLGFKGVPVSEQTTPSVPISTDVRFSLQSAFWIMAFVGVASAAVGAFIRQFPADARPRLVLYWAILIVSLIGLLYFKARDRYRAEQAAGRRLFEFQPHSYFFPGMPNVARLVFGFVLLMSGVLVWMFVSVMLAEPKFRVSFLMIAWTSMWGAMGSAGGVVYLWWNRRIHFCEHGIVVRDRFRPWADCVRFYWDACNKNVLVAQWQSATRGNGSVAVRVPVDDREAVAALVAENVAANSAKKHTA